MQPRSALLMQPVVGSVGVVHIPSSWIHSPEWYVIQVGTQSRYNHTAIVSWASADEIWVIEAAAGGVSERALLPEELPNWRFEADPAITPEQRASMVLEADRLIGTPYDWMDIAKFLVRFFLGRVSSNRKDYADNRVMCSEMVAWCLHVAGIDPWPTTAYGAVSPGDVAEWMFMANHTFGGVLIASEKQHTLEP